VIAARTFGQDEEPSSAPDSSNRERLLLNPSEVPSLSLAMRYANPLSKQQRDF